MSGGWGLGSWGLSPWGLGSGLAGFGITRAYALGDRMVSVTLSEMPLEASSTTDGAVFNPTVWQVYVPSTGRTLTVLSVTADETYPLTYVLLTLEPFEPHQVTMRVRTTTLKDVNGVAVGTLQADYAGALREAVSTPEKRTTNRGFGIRDIANPPTPNSPVGGTLEITSSGDYKSVEGAALLKKLIYRRLVSRQGDFFHLPNYGIGLREKEPLPSSDLIKLRTQIEAQILLEPEVETAAVRVSYDYAAEALIVQMRVRMRKTGQEIDAALPIPTGAIQL